MVRAYLRELHSPDGWELKADSGYHKGDFCPGDWWDPEVHVVDLCENKDVVGCISSLKVVEV